MFDPDFLLPDSALRDTVAFDVQAFLDRLDSPLATVTFDPVGPGGPRRTAADLLQRAVQESPMDVRVLLTKLQVEQSLLTGEASAERLDRALGYGATDAGRLEEYRGFATQVAMAARTLVGYLDSRHPLTVVGQVGRPMKVSDGVVTPRNLATAALYRYTPWIGDGRAGSLIPPFGNYLFYKVWTELFGSEPQAAPTDPRDWRLIVPQDNWKNPLQLPEEAVFAVREAAGRLGLLVGEDAARRKLYLGRAGAPASQPPVTPTPANGLEYPSGQRLRRVRLEEIGAAEAARYRPARPDQAAPLVEAHAEARLSPHFRMAEFLPRDPSYRFARVSPALVALLERLRTELGGAPLHVNSGYRPPAYNLLVGGARESLHLDGLAADVSCLDVPFSRLAAVADRVVGNTGGVGTYWSQDFVHVDLRGERVRWP